ncbi:O-antigen ligase family protein [Deinococcus apachensis]|uniref:O-antigen ligase family protein n=1 Tax=Deinococcus apachensis TaxID=309886 RepID=UPI0012FAFFBC|nr:O-antigen ligase family protein [Deinococcus apachensis]
MLISEVLLYVLAGAYLLLSGPARRLSLPWVLPCAVVLLLSALTGVLQWGMQAVPLLYALRLLGTLTAGILLGTALYLQYGQAFKRVTRLFVRLYLAVVALAFLLLLLFPDSRDLWAWLSRMGVVFQGDPHLNRLVSAYFDPNFFGVILLLPLTWSYVLLHSQPAFRWWAVLVLTLVAILLTGSRSALAAAVLQLLFLLFLSALVAARRSWIDTRHLLQASLSPILLLALLPFYLPYLARTLIRLSTIGDDRSAAARFDSYDFGMQLIAAHPLFGVGYNYLSMFTEQYRRLPSLDSSLQATAANFGIPFTILLLGLTITAAFRWGARLRGPLAFGFWAYWACLAVTILFASQFNNVLYYVFWLLPALGYTVYLGHCARRQALGRATP